MFDSDRTTISSGGTDLLGLAQRRMQWLQQREQVLANNVANADTPGYTPRDMSPFTGVMAQFDVSLAATEPGHLAGSGGANAGHKVRTVSEKSPDGNAVSLDAQMEQVADTNDQQRLSSNIYTYYKTMFSTVLGK